MQAELTGERQLSTHHNEDTVMKAAKGAFKSGTLCSLPAAAGTSQPGSLDYKGYPGYLEPFASLCCGGGESIFKDSGYYFKENKLENTNYTELTTCTVFLDFVCFQQIHYCLKKNLRWTKQPSSKGLAMRC
ncbi:unnamed protein product [Caretta caretta]